MIVIAVTLAVIVDKPRMATTATHATGLPC
jgi:hypothetical protein